MHFLFPLDAVAYYMCHNGPAPGEHISTSRPSLFFIWSLTQA